LSCGCLYARGQTPPKAETPTPASSCGRANALELIRQQIDVTKTFDNTVQRITVLVRAADLLWPYQPDQARAAFADAFEFAKQNFKEAGDDPRRDARFAMTEVPDQRYTVINGDTQGSVSETISEQNAPKLTFDEQVEAAEKNRNVDRRDQQLSFAVTRATTEESLDRLLSVVDKISDSAGRAQLLNWIYFNRTEAAIKDQKLDEARRLAAKVEELDNRAYLYSRIAEESLKQNPDQTQARELLDEAVAAAAKAPATMVTARSLLGVAYLYSKIDLSRAVAVMGDAVKCINRLEAPDFSRQFAMRKIPISHCAS
jgi:hypothetical protein